jgi:hypothetical protein
MMDRRWSLAPVALALVLAMAAPATSFAQSPSHRGAAAGVAGAGIRGGGAAPAGRFVGGGAQVGRSGGGGGGAPTPSFRGAGRVQPQAHIGGGGGAWHGGSYGHGHRHGGGFIPGAVAGGIIGGIIASDGYGYYGAPGYYDDQYYDDAAAAPLEGDDAAAYCMQTYRSYDPQSGTYLGYDGLRHPCP